MTDIDTSAEAAERLAALFGSRALQCFTFNAKDENLKIAATLRALVRERDKAIEARTEAIKEMCKQAREAGSLQGIADGKDIIIRQLEAQRDAAWQAGAEAMRQRAANAMCPMLRSMLARGDAFQTILALPIPERPA